MPKDILSFRHGSVNTIPSGRPIPIGQPHAPARGRQTQRLGPRFQSLSDAMTRQSAALQQNIQGLEPEFVLVFEVAGGVADFYRAAQRAGMEWLCDFDDMSEADEEFYNLNNKGLATSSPVSEKLYLTMTNQTAMQQLLSLWQIYTSEHGTYPEGMTPFREVFSHLRDIRRWNVHDRFDDTNVANIWQELLEQGSGTIRFEIELWYRKDQRKRDAAQAAIVGILGQYGGRLVKASIYDEIGFHGLIVDCPSEEISRMINNHDHELLNADQIMSIRASGQVISVFDSEEEICDSQTSDSDLPTQPPVIALIDGLPLANHQLLANRLNINDVDNVEQHYQAAQRCHGTSMASLIIHGDLNHPLPALQSYLYVRPIMQPNAFGEEQVPDDIFFVDALHNSIREIGENEHLRNSIRIINISIGNSNKPFVHALSPEAKMIDWLSNKYNLLIVISSGNCAQNINMPMTLGDYKNLGQDEQQKNVYHQLWSDQSVMKILCPSESINGICVGASHSDYANVPPTLENPIKIGYPASYSCFGGGYQNSIKPDLVVPGGRMLFQTFGIESNPVDLRAKVKTSLKSTGQRTASANNGLIGLAHLFGTSNSAALTSRLCADFLVQLRSTASLNIPSDYESIALKAMLIHCCSWDTIGKELMNHIVPNIPRKNRSEVLKWIGYGFPNPEISLFCTDQRVTLMGYGQIGQNQCTDFKFPLPDCLISQAVNKRLTISLAWFSPVAAKNKNYRLAKLSFDAKDRNALTKSTMESDTKTSKRGTVQHEVYEGHQASTYISGTDLCITVLCKKEPLLIEPVKFVLMASLEVAPETQLPIYQEVEVRLQSQVQVGYVHN